MEILRFALLGLGASGAYCILAMGIVVIYRGSGVVNFAHGATAMVAAYVAYAEVRVTWPDAPGIVIVMCGVLAGGLVSTVQYALLMRGVRESSPLTRLVATLGVMLLLQALAALRYGDDNLFVRSLFPVESVTVVPGAAIPVEQLAIAAVAVAIAAVLWVIYRATPFGLATQAISESTVITAALGWKPERIALANWFVGGCLAGLGGVLITPLVGLQVATLSLLVVTALAAALVGSLNSFPLTFVGAFVIGIGQSEAGRFIDLEGASTAVPLVVVLLVLVVSGRSIPLRGELLDRLPRVGTGQCRPATAVVTALSVLTVLWLLPSATWVAATATSMITALLLLSLVVLTGYAGQISLAQWAIAGFGAFVSGRLVATTGMPFVLALVVAVLAAVPLGVAFSLPALRTRGASLAVATLSMGVAAFVLLFNNYHLTGGTLGTVLETPRIVGVSVDPVEHPARYATLVLVVLAAALVTVGLLRRSRLGLRMLAVRSDERSAGALGINVSRTKILAFTIAAVLASTAGVLSAFQGKAVLYSRFDVTTSILIVAFVVIGGVGYASGAIIGSLFAAGGLGALVFAQVNGWDRYLNVVAAAVVLLNIVTNPHGLADTFSVLRQKIRRGRAAATVAVLEEEDVYPAESGGEGLAVSHLVLRYGPVTVLRDLTLTVEPGEVVGVIGPNGAGKTSLIDALTGFTPTAAGSIYLHGRRLDQVPTHIRFERGLSRSFQGTDLVEELTVAENLQLSVRSTHARRPAKYGLSTLRVPPACADAVRILGLEELLTVFPPELSVGQRRLCGVARALAGNPRIVLLDEPAAGLDQRERQALSALLRALADRWGMGVLLVEHNVPLVASVCDRIYAIDQGVVISQGAPDLVVRSEPVVTSYLGRSHAQGAPKSTPFVGGV